MNWTLDNNGTLTISGTGAMEDYYWSDETPWHEQRESITKVIIKAGVTTIGDSAFSRCFNLTSLTIPDSVTFIGNSAFSGCIRLMNVTIPDSVTTIGEWAFSNCNSLTSLTIPDSVATIGEGVFCSCGLTNLTIPSNVTTISKNAFSDCRSLTSITFSDSITTIGDSTFRKCSSLTSVTIPNSVTIIDEWAFSECSSLISVTIPNSVKTIKWAAFIGCSSLTSITIPDSVTTIGNAVFDGCNQLKKIYYPSGRGFEKVLSMGNKAQLIPYISLPRLKFIPVDNLKPKPAVNQLRWKVEGKTLTVGGVSEIKSYSYEATPWRDSLRDIQRIIIEDGVRKIAANAFAECTRLEQLTIPASVKTIGDGAFTFCYCGDRTINGGRNVIWSLEDGTLMIKKNPAAKNESNFSTGYETWQVVEGNITGVKIERGIVPAKNFFDWLGRMGDGVSVAF